VAVSQDLAAEYRILGDYAGPERYRFEKSDGPRPFGKTIHVAVSARRVFLGTADSFHVDIFDHRGLKKGRIHRQEPLKEFRAPEKAFYLDEVFRGRRNAEQKRRIRRAVDEMVFPKHLPAYSAFLVDERNKLWIEEAFAAADRSRLWRAFSEDGAEVGTLETPPQFALLELNETDAVGKWTDADGVESVRRFSLVRR